MLDKPSNDPVHNVLYDVVEAPWYSKPNEDCV